MKRIQKYPLIAISGVLAIIIVLIPKWVPIAKRASRELAISRILRGVANKIARARNQNADDDDVGGPMTSPPPNASSKA